MLASYLRAAILGFVLFAGAAFPARADDLADFNAAVEEISAHNRVAIGYLRTGNSDLASLELDRLRAAWGELTKRFAGKRPAVFDGNKLYVTALTDISTRLVTADLMLNSGRPEVARQALEGVRDDIYALRTSAGVKVLADCIFDSNKAAAAFMAYDTPELDWSKPGVANAVAEKAAAYAGVLDRCDAVASEAVRKQSEFRRLIEEAKTELAKVPHAVEHRDAAQLHRIVGSLRAIDNLLAFRFG
jgi:hypothetical protein